MGFHLLLNKTSQAQTSYKLHAKNLNRIMKSLVMQAELMLRIRLYLHGRIAELFVHRKKCHHNAR